MSMTQAEKHGHAVQHGIETYRRVFIHLFAREVEGGRVPGTAEVSGDEARAFFDARPAEDWYALATTNPEAAINELRQYARAQ